MGKSSYKFRCLPLAIGCYRYILVVHPNLVIGKPTLLRLVSLVLMLFKMKHIRLLESPCPLVTLYVFTPSRGLK